MTGVSPITFTILAGIAIACALLVVFKKNPVSSAFSLVLLFAAFAGIYAMLGAHLIAALQILVYAGAIMVLFVFVIMLLNADEPSFDLGRSHPALRVLVGLFCATLLGFFIWAEKNSPGMVAPGAFTTGAVADAGGNSKVVSELMFSRYILPFELTSVLLLGGIVGAVAIAKRNQTGRASDGKRGI
jgi:NADH-quinone oxidoreductase subunit J